MVERLTDPHLCHEQWNNLRRHFSTVYANRKNRRTSSKEMSAEVTYPKIKRSKKRFPTGSQYEGSWDILGMSGYGVYTYPNGVIYKGEFDDGTFHGNGELTYPSGIKLQGRFRRGEMIERSIVFGDNVEHGEDWHYCSSSDRRFTIEIENGIEPTDRSYMTAEQPTIDVPPGYYDTEDGFYDPKTQFVFEHEDLTSCVRAVCKKEDNWIKKHCRTDSVGNLGPTPSLYEDWCTPTLKLPEVEKLKKPKLKTSYIEVSNDQEDAKKGNDYFALDSESDCIEEEGSDSENETFNYFF